MQVSNFHRSELKMFDDQHLNLVYNQDMFLPFIQRVFSVENIEKQMKDKASNFNDANRTILVEALKKQYSSVGDKQLVLSAIESLNDSNTFTITTGHQLSIFTGPLYFVVKILHVIKLSETLKERYPENNFVPVFWMASEDHDFQEIQSLKIFNDTLSWNSDRKGPVGRFDLDGLENVKSEIATFFNNHPESEIHELIKAYDGDNLADATRNLVHSLFKQYGLVIIDGDDRELKKLFAPQIQQELVEQFSHKAVSATNELLKKEGAKIQVKPRELNLFYIKKGIRSRIEKQGENYSIAEVGEFTQTQILNELEQHPENFSPNVILRPLYQETILPNLAYIGGVGEISYWLQLKGVFDAVNCTYPLIGIRNSVLWIDGSISKKIAKIELRLEDLFKATDVIKKEYVEQNSGLDVNVKSLESEARKLADSIQKAIIAVAPSMENYAAAEVARLNKQVASINAKLLQLSKANHEDVMKSIEQIKDKLFPAGELQERSSNFFSFCPDGNFTDRLEVLYKSLNPIENDFIVLREI